MASSSNPAQMATDLSSSKKKRKTPSQKQESFVNEPDLQDPSAPSWQTQVLIPAPEPLTHAYLGPLPDPSVETEELGEIFPTHSDSMPIIFKDTPFHLECLDNPIRIFRSAPKVDNEPYLNWLNKIQAEKSETWKEQGIFDLIQLSRFGPRYNSVLILAALHFWDSTTHSLHLKCGMISPTLLDVAAIAGLKPLGETFDPRLSNNTYGFDFNNLVANFAPFIAEHHDTSTKEVSDLEYIAFLTFWLSFYVFCTRSLKVAKSFIPLAIQIHEKRNVNLAKLILGSFYQLFDVASTDLKKDIPSTHLVVSGPVWLLQLWLLATFESKLDLIMPPETAPSLKNRRTEGFRLAQLLSRYTDATAEQLFTTYYTMFLECDTFEGSMAPFVTRKYGPAWFTKESPSPSSENEEETNQIWQAYLSPAILSTKLSPQRAKNSFGTSMYFPSYLARQFGLCQIRPAPAYTRKEELNCPETETAYFQRFKNFPYKDLKFEPIKFSPKFSCTKKFHKWWLEYYNGAVDGLTAEDFLEKISLAYVLEEVDEEAEEEEEEAPKASTPVKPPKEKKKKATQVVPKAVIAEESPRKSKRTKTPPVPKEKKKAKSPSPSISTKRKGKSIDLSVPEEETDSDDDIPVAKRQAAMAMAARMPPRGLIIKERAEQQPPAKKQKVQSSRALSKGQETQAVKAPGAKKKKSSSTKPVSSATTTTPATFQATPVEASQEPQLDTVAKGFEVSRKTSTAEGGTNEAVVEADALLAAQLEQELEKRKHVEEKVEEPKTSPATETIPALDEEKDESHGKVPIACEESSVKVSSTSAVSSQNLSRLKEEDPLEALRLMLSLSSSSPKLIGSSSTTSLTSVNQETSEGLLKQLKAKVLEGDLLAKISEDKAEYSAIKAIIDKIHKSDPNPELLAFLVEFEPLFEQLFSIAAQCASKRTLKKQAETKLNASNQAVQASQTNIADMKTEATQDEGKLVKLDTEIQQLNEDIKALQTRLTNAETEKSQIEKKLAANSVESKMKAEAKKAIRHLEEANEHDATIKQLSKELSHLNTAIAVNVNILDRLKTLLRSL